MLRQLLTVTSGCPGAAPDPQSGAVWRRICNPRIGRGSIPGLSALAYLLIGFALVVSSCRKEQEIPVTPGFNYTVISGGGNTVPVDVSFTNTSSGATAFRWTFEGGTPASSEKAEPGTVRFGTAGPHKVILEAWNADAREKKETVINLDSALTVAFDTAVLMNNLSPATVRITNRTTGASSFEWTFEGGSPAAFSGPNPPEVTFTAPGEHGITLKAGNGGSFFTLTKKITVGPALAAAFSIVPSFQDEDYEAPLTATLSNTTVGGTSWQWSATGGLISDAAAQQPTIYFPSPGTYTVTLIAGNGKTTETIARIITVKPNTNLRTHQDVKLGIASAHSSVGAFYSTLLRKTFTAADNLDTAGKWIDIVFFGLNQHFAFNKFISPDSTQHYALPAIAGAPRTVFINSQEICGCGTPFTATDFDNMATDAPLQGRSITPTPAGTHAFSDATANRVVLFRTADGRKGAIKLKQHVQAGAGSYILADIKVQKNN